MDRTEPAGRSEFTNGVVDTPDLPRVDDHDFEPLDPAYARLRTMFAIGAAVAVILVTAGVALSTSSWVAVLAGAGALAVVVLVGVIHRLEVTHMGYLVREHDLSFCRGVIGRAVATVPFARVQHVSITRGPVERRYGLASLQLRTAGGQVAIPGLNAEFAERLKELVADRAGSLADAESDAESDIDAA